jgi:creatinine amidohydrolase/Fe(II)-dependent formamide hydrolase-like protein
VMSTFFPAQSAAAAVSDLRALEREAVDRSRQRRGKSSFRRALRTSYETSVLGDSPDHTKQDGTEVVNMVLDRVRAELLRRIGLTGQSKSAA